MIVFMTNASINNMKRVDKGKAETVDCWTAQVSIEHFTKREEGDILLKILSIKSLEWHTIHRY